jgi:GNAT superfamily N-acetyltransferase
MNSNLRSLESQDRDGLKIILTGIPSFNDEDQRIALELIDIALNDPQQKDYLFALAVDDNNQSIGYACYGPTPLTDGTFDLYWIVVDQKKAGQGVGSLLLHAVEEDVLKRKGRLLIIETSSSDGYDQTRQFYLKNNYLLMEIIKDFYRPGEDRVTFVKRLKS